CGESDQCRSPIGRVRLACDEAARDERVHEPSDRPRRHLECLGKDTLGHRSALPELPKQMRARWREVERLDRLRHVVVQQIDELVAAESKVAIRVSFRGTHQGEFQGIPATGRTIHYVSHEFYRVENGLFAEEWICSDMASVFRQLS